MGQLRRRRLARLAAAAILCAGAAAARDCAVTGVEGGGAQIWDGRSWARAAPGPLPPAQVRIVTDDESRIEIGCDDGVTLTLAPSSDLRLIDLLGKDAGENVILRLLRGLLGVDAPGPRAGRFDVRTPLAIASARSTAWLVEHLPERGSAIFVARGAVWAISRGAQATLRRGEGIDVRVEGAGPVVRWGPPRVAAARAALGFGWR
jgi:ferric-dicitrate binding protein FerR (iron transport regulator)